MAVKGGLRWGRRETRGGAVGVNQGGLVWPGLEGWVEIKRGWGIKGILRIRSICFRYSLLPLKRSQA